MKIRTLNTNRLRHHAAQLAIVGALVFGANCAETLPAGPGAADTPVDTLPTAPTAQLPVRTLAEWDQWPWHGMSFSGAVSLSAVSLPDSVAGQLAISFIATTTADSVQLQHGACAFSVRLYRNESLSGAPVWDNRPPPNAGCILPLYIRTISAVRPLSMRFGTLRPIRDSIPDGKYWLAATVRINNAIRVIPAGAVEIVRP